MIPLSLVPAHLTVQVATRRVPLRAENALQQTVRRVEQMTLGAVGGLSGPLQFWSDVLGVSPHDTAHLLEFVRGCLTHVRLQQVPDDAVGDALLTLVHDTRRRAVALLRGRDPHWSDAADGSANDSAQREKLGDMLLYMAAHSDLPDSPHIRYKAHTPVAALMSVRPQPTIINRFHESIQTEVVFVLTVAQALSDGATVDVESGITTLAVVGKPMLRMQMEEGVSALLALASEIAERKIAPFGSLVEPRDLDTMIRNATHRILNQIESPIQRLTIPLVQIALLYADGRTYDTATWAYLYGITETDAAFLLRIAYGLCEMIGAIPQMEIVE